MIKRYELYALLWDHSRVEPQEIEEDKEGDWVKYEDHKKAIEEAEKEIALLRKQRNEEITFGYNNEESK